MRFLFFLYLYLLAACFIFRGALGDLKKNKNTLKAFLKPQLRRKVFVIVCAGTLLMLSGCAKPLNGDFCLLYRPVFSSPLDTEETLKQVDMNNIVWAELCS